MVIRCNTCFFTHDLTALITGMKNFPFFGAGSIFLNDIKFRIIIVSFVIAGFKGDIQVLCNIRNRKDNRFSVSIKGISEICPQFQAFSVFTFNEQFIKGKPPLLRANIIFFAGKIKVNTEILTFFQLVGRILQRSKPCSIYKVYKAKCSFFIKYCIEGLAFYYCSQRKWMLIILICCPTSKSINIILVLDGRFNTLEYNLCIIIAFITIQSLASIV